MRDVNRCVVILRVKQPCLDWMMRLPDPSPPKLTLADLNDDHTALLIPDFDDNAEAMRYIEAHCEELFKHELNDWWTNEKDWRREEKRRKTGKS